MPDNLIDHASENPVLQSLNNALGPADDQATASLTPNPPQPICFIVALPRGGSTLLHQMIISSFEIGYASNILARFWEAPYFGAQLHKQIANPHFTSTCQSTFGLTDGPEEPHEWTWFWQKHLLLSPGEHYVSQKEKIDWVYLGKKLTALQSVFEAPLIFDNIMAMNAFSLMKEHLTSSFPLFLERNPYYVCNSVINLRLNRLKDISALKFHLTRNADELNQIKDPIEQIVLQVRSALNEIEELKNSVPERHRLIIKYDDLKSNPEEQIDRFGHFMACHGAKMIRRPAKVADPEPNRNQEAFINKRYRSQLDRYFAKYF